jgi:hypothetical protein
MAKLKLKSNENGSGNVILQSPNTNSDYTLSLPEYNGTLTALNSSGNFGIGEDSPMRPIHISNSEAAYIRLEDTGGTAGGATNAAIELYANGVKTGFIGSGTSGGYMGWENFYGSSLFYSNDSSGTARVENLALHPGGSVFNGLGGDVDFRVESNTSEHALFVVGSNSRVGINNSAPEVDLDVNGSIMARTNNENAGEYTTIAYRFFEGRGWGYNKADDSVFYNGANNKIPFRITPQAVHIDDAPITIGGASEAYIRLQTDNTELVDTAVIEIHEGPTTEKGNSNFTIAYDGSENVTAGGGSLLFRGLTASTYNTEYARFARSGHTFLGLAGNVGIGIDATTIPAAKLHVDGDLLTNDLILSNMDRKEGPNEVDGTRGHWCIQEGDENLFIINRNTGKKYKFLLEEIE